MEYLLVAKRAGGVGVSVFTTRVVQWNWSLCGDEFLLTSRVYKELKIS
jgi:hypothetical protein